MTNPKMPEVKEYADTLFIDGKEVPYILLDKDGNTTTKATSDGHNVQVTITFLARSYHLDPYKQIHGSGYQFKKAPLYKRLLLRIQTLLNH